MYLLEKPHWQCRRNLCPNRGSELLLSYFYKASLNGSVEWGSRIHRLHLCRGVRLPNECPGYDIKQSDGEVPLMLEFWVMRSIPLLLSLPGPPWTRVVAPDRVLSMG